MWEVLLIKLKVHRRGVHVAWFFFLPPNSETKFLCANEQKKMIISGVIIVIPLYNMEIKLI